MKTQSEIDKYWLGEALKLAEQAKACGEVPVGVVVVKANQSISRAFNRPIMDNDPTAHAEILALRQAGATLNNYRLNGCSLYVTLEPCPMCAMAIVHARVERVVFSTTDPKIGAVCSIQQMFDDQRYNHQVKWEQGSYTQEAKQLLQQFFLSCRQLN